MVPFLSILSLKLSMVTLSGSKIMHAWSWYTIHANVWLNSSIATMEKYKGMHIYFPHQRSCLLFATAFGQSSTYLIKMTHTEAWHLPFLGSSDEGVSEDHEPQEEGRHPMARDASFRAPFVPWSPKSLHLVWHGLQNLEHRREDHGRLFWLNRVTLVAMLISQRAYPGGLEQQH